MLFWSTVATAFKIALRGLTFTELLFWSSVSSSVSLFAAFLLGKNKIEVLFRRKNLKYLAIGLLNPFLYYNVLFKAYSLLPAQEAQPLNYTWPVILSIMAAIAFKERIKWKTIAGLALAFLGVMIISTGGKPASFSFTNPLGDILAIGSSVLWALYWIFNLNDREKPEVKLFLSFISGTLVIVFQTRFTTGLHFNAPVSIAAAVYTGIFEMGITFLLWYRVMDLAENKNSVTVLGYAAPFISLIFIHFILKEQIRFYSVTGLLFIVSGILINLSGRKKKN